MKNTLDQADLGILKILQVCNTTPQSEIAEVVGLSPAAVQRRIKRMRETKIILSDVSVIDRDKVGGMITLIVEVSLNSERIDFIDEAKRVFEATPEVQQCYYVTGDFDFLLIIITPSMVEYEKLTRRIFFSNDNIKKFRTTVAMNAVKTEMSIPIELLK